MKSLFKIVLFSFVLSFVSCGTGSYTVVSGKEDNARICFVANESYSIDVTIDGQNYSTQTVKDSQFKARRNMKETSKTAIIVAPGRHTVEVKKGGQQLYSKEVFVSASDTKVIEL